MLLPWIHSTKIFARSKKYNYWGNSCKTGFHIDVQNIKSGIISTFYTEGYSQGKTDQPYEPQMNKLRENIPWQEYHACEHKLIALLYEGVPITKETLKSAPKNSYRCGSVLTTFIYECKIITVVTIILTLLSLTMELHLAMPIIFFLCFFAGIIAIDSMGKKMRLLSATLLILPPIAEYFLFLNNPRDSIIEEGVELGKQIENQLAEWAQST